VAYFYTPSNIEEFVRERIQGYSLNVCAGLSELCDEKLDLDPQRPDITKGNMYEIPFRNGTFDTVVSDPPWKIAYYERMRPFFECVRVTKVGGSIIYNSYWIPEGRNTELLELWVRQDKPFSNTSILAVFRKTREELAEELPNHKYAIHTDQETFE